MNNEMDELFRKAGEDYPLNLGKPDWDAVAGKLHTDMGGLGPGFGLAANAPRKRWRSLWLLLLLLPLGIYGLTRLTGRSADGNLQPAGRGLQAGKAVDGDSQAAGRGLQAGKKAVGDSQAAGSRLQAGKKTLNKSGPTDKKLPGGDATAPSITDNNNRNMNTGSAKGGFPGGANVTPSTDNAETAGNTADSSAATTSPQNSFGEDASPLAEIVMTEKAKGKGTGTTKKTSSVLTDQNGQKKDSANEKKSLVHPSIKQQRGFYAGITAAPDFSTVKFQTMKSTGYSFGVIAGYRLNRHWSVETGLSWDRKKYYSKGEYFDKSKTKIPSTVKVTYIDGYCEMFEIPLTLRYDLNSGKKGHWFAAAGFSSYLMKNENYLYGAESNNVAWSRNVDYKNSGNNFFSILQLSAGYEYNWSSRNRIRIEPYFKAPVSGVGIGSLPISSLGMTFGFVHSFR